MKKLLIGFAAAATLALGMSQASAGGGGGGGHHHPHINPGFSFGITIGDGFYDDPFWDEPVRPIRRVCTVERASQKARAMGIRHQTIIKYPDVIKVKGRADGHRVQVLFARAPGCPVVSY